MPFGKKQPDQGKSRSHGNEAKQITVNHSRAASERNLSLGPPGSKLPIKKVPVLTSIESLSPPSQVPQKRPFQQEEAVDKHHSSISATLKPPSSELVGRIKVANADKAPKRCHKCGAIKTTTLCRPVDGQVVCTQCGLEKIMDPMEASQSTVAQATELVKEHVQGRKPRITHVEGKEGENSSQSSTVPVIHDIYQYTGPVIDPRPPRPWVNTTRVSLAGKTHVGSLTRDVKTAPSGVPSAVVTLKYNPARLVQSAGSSITRSSAESDPVQRASQKANPPSRKRRVTQPTKKFRFKIRPPKRPDEPTSKDATSLATEPGIDLVTAPGIQPSGQPQATHVLHEPGEDLPKSVSSSQSIKQAVQGLQESEVHQGCFPQPKAQYQAPHDTKNLQVNYPEAIDPLPRKIRPKRSPHPRTLETKVCVDCGTYDSPAWRKDEIGKELCNKCMLRRRRVADQASGMNRKQKAPTSPSDLYGEESSRIDITAESPRAPTTSAEDDVPKSAIQTQFDQIGGAYSPSRRESNGSVNEPTSHCTGEQFPRDHLAQHSNSSPRLSATTEHLQGAFDHSKEDKSSSSSGIRTNVASNSETGSNSNIKLSTHDSSLDAGSTAAVIGSHTISPSSLSANTWHERSSDAYADAQLRRSFRDTHDMDFSDDDGQDANAMKKEDASASDGHTRSPSPDHRMH